MVKLWKTRHKIRPKNKRFEIFLKNFQKTLDKRNRMLYNEKVADPRGATSLVIENWTTGFWTQMDEISECVKESRQNHFEKLEKVRES